MRLCINEEKGKRISSLFCVCRFVALAMLQGAETAYPLDLQKRKKVNAERRGTFPKKAMVASFEAKAEDFLKGLN